MPFTTRQTMLAAAAGGATLLPATEAAAVGPITRDEDTVAPVARLAVRAHDRAVERHVRLKRTNTRLRGVEARRTRREVRDWSLIHLREANRSLARKNRTLRKRGATTTAGPAVKTPAHLEAIAACESGGDPSAVDATGTYRGKYQFDLQTWASVGGSGDPASAPEAEQDKRAAMLYARAGASPWPVCGS